MPHLKKCFLDIIDKMYQDASEVDIKEIDLDQSLIANEYIVMQNRHLPSMR